MFIELRSYHSREPLSINVADISRVIDGRSFCTVYYISTKEFTAVSNLYSEIMRLIRDAAETSRLAFAATC